MSARPQRSRHPPISESPLTPPPTRSTTGTRLSAKAFQAISRALADPRRFAIFEQIAASDTLQCSCLRQQGVISPATISHHIKELSEAGLIEVERQGRTAQLTLRRNVWEAYLKRLGGL